MKTYRYVNLGIIFLVLTLMATATYPNLLGFADKEEKDGSNTHVEQDLEQKKEENKEDKTQDQPNQVTQQQTSIPQSGPDEGDNNHPSGKDRSEENEQSGSQGKSNSDPDGSKNAYGGNSGKDKQGYDGGADKGDQDNNNGCGNDDDFEDDNNGKCKGKGKRGNKPPKSDPTPTPAKEHPKATLTPDRPPQSMPTPTVGGSPPVGNPPSIIVDINNDVTYNSSFETENNLASEKKDSAIKGVSTFAETGHTKQTIGLALEMIGLLIVGVGSLYTFKKNRKSKNSIYTYW